ncbi:sensor histidine kinase [Pedobacter caeni]|uniref:GHKL domain-containing protein n=1 Tax=Pedobacter caeni TaxID=288992 RepID=A0A1M5BDW8_9SPHI|nr:sensor histidine kinase [Pedobacter caeni]SHF40362.1 GHKL domain-containing protein [Pedobacter caeni]
MILLLNLIFLILVLRLSFEKSVMNVLLNGKWPGVIYMQHILFWLGFIGVSGYVYLSLFNVQEALYRLLFMLAINIPLYLLCFKRLVPQYYQTKRYGEYVLYTAGIFVISSLIRILLEPELFNNGIEAEGKYIFMIYLTQIIIILVPSMQGISRYKLMVEQELAELVIRKKEADLELVKSKINPHFLFNTLNNIYSHSYATDSDSANLIKQLSLLMQYTTYEVEKKTIPIEREIQMITALATLYQLKSKSKLDMELDFEANELFSVMEIPPTIYLTLFENAVKYSVIGQDEDAYIRLKLSLDDSVASFSISNSISEEKVTEHSPSYRGAGLQVLKMMLDNQYGENYTLESVQKGVDYSTLLTIRI